MSAVWSSSVLAAAALLALLAEASASQGHALGGGPELGAVFNSPR